MFGLLEMMKGVANRYKHASISNFKNVKVFLIQAYNEHFYLWSMKYVGNDLYCLFRERKVKVPFNFNCKSTELFDYILFANEVKFMLEEAIKDIIILKEEHDINIKRRRYLDPSKYDGTLDNIIKPTIIKISTIRGFKGIGNEVSTIFS